MSGQVLARFGDSASRDAPSPARERRADAVEADPRTSVRLSTLGRHATGTVAGVRVHAADADGRLDPDLERMALRLMEIGFVQGATLRVIAFGQPGNDPIGVRVGGRGGITTFALRRLEADCVWVWPDAKR